MTEATTGGSAASVVDLPMKPTGKKTLRARVKRRLTIWANDEDGEQIEIVLEYKLPSVAAKLDFQRRHLTIAMQLGAAEAAGKGKQALRDAAVEEILHNPLLSVDVEELMIEGGSGLLCGVISGFELDPEDEEPECGEDGKPLDVCDVIRLFYPEFCKWIGAKAYLDTEIERDTSGDEEQPADGDWQSTQQIEEAGASSDDVGKSAKPTA